MGFDPELSKLGLNVRGIREGNGLVETDPGLLCWFGEGNILPLSQ